MITSLSAADLKLQQLLMPHLTDIINLHITHSLPNHQNHNYHGDNEMMMMIMIPQHPFDSI